MSKFKDLNYNMNTIEGPSFVMTNFEYAKRRRG